MTTMITPWPDLVWTIRLGKRQEDEPSHYFMPLVSVVSPCTATRAMRIRRIANFTEEHWQQTDRSLNRELWRLFSTDREKLDQRIRKMRFLCFVACGYGHPDLLKEYGPDDFIVTGGYGEYDPDCWQMIGFYERERLASNLRLVDDLVSELKKAGLLTEEADIKSPIDVLAEKKANDAVLSLEDAIDRADLLLQEGTQLVGSTSDMPYDRGMQEVVAKGIRKLVDALLVCWPWSCSPLIMGVKTACSSGLSRVEHQIWFALFNGCVLLHDPALRRHARTSGWKPLPELRTRGPEADGRYLGLTFARLCALALVYSPFVDRMHLNRGYYGVEITSRFFPWLKDEAGIARRGIAATNAPEDYTYEGWAHRHCVEDHYTCQMGRWAPGQLEELRAFRRALAEYLRGLAESEAQNRVAHERKWPWWYEPEPSLLAPWQEELMVKIRRRSKASKAAEAASGAVRTEDEGRSAERRQESNGSKRKLERYAEASEEQRAVRPEGSRLRTRKRRRSSAAEAQTCETAAISRVSVPVPESVSASHAVPVSGLETARRATPAQAGNSTSSAVYVFDTDDEDGDSMDEARAGGAASSAVYVLDSDDDDEDMAMGEAQAGNTVSSALYVLDTDDEDEDMAPEAQAGNAAFSAIYVPDTDDEEDVAVDEAQAGDAASSAVYVPDTDDEDEGIVDKALKRRRARRSWRPLTPASSAPVAYDPVEAEDNAPSPSLSEPEDGRLSTPPRTPTRTPVSVPPPPRARQPRGAMVLLSTTPAAANLFEAESESVDAPSVDGWASQSSRRMRMTAPSPSPQRPGRSLLSPPSTLGSRALTPAPPYTPFERERDPEPQLEPEPEPMRESRPLQLKRIDLKDLPRRLLKKVYIPNAAPPVNYILWPLADPSRRSLEDSRRRVKGKVSMGQKCAKVLDLLGGALLYS